MSLETILALYGVGLVLICLEPFLPGGGTLAVLGAIGVVVSVVHAFGESTLLGGGLTAAAVVVTPVVIYLGLKRMVLKRELKKEEGYTSPQAGREALVGKTGIALTPLHPAGTMLLDGRRYDVVTQGESVDKDVTVDVIRVDGPSLVVRAVRKPA